MGDIFDSSKCTSKSKNASARALFTSGRPRFFGGQEFSIISCSLDDCPEYETVSYVWGSSDRCKTISLADGKSLAVTASLELLLSSIVKASETGYLWIDQITINQDDHHERGAQVRIMGEIYRHCKTCLVWMDDYSSQEVPLTRRSREIGPAVQKFFHSFGFESLPTSTRKDSIASRRDSVTSHRDSLTSKTQSSTDDQETNDDAQERRSSPSPPNVKLTASDREHILWFLEHPWFRRTWVYQEFVLSRKCVFLIDSFQLLGVEVERAFKSNWIETAAWYTNLSRQLSVTTSHGSVYGQSSGCKFLVAARRYRLIHSKSSIAPGAPINSDKFVAYESSTFTDILDILAANKAHDDRDHVYGFLGLAPNLLKHMEIDYEVSVEQAFAALTKAMIKDCKTLDFLEFARTEADLGQSRLNLPSWVPDWTFTTRRIHLLCQDNLFEAAGEGYGLPKIYKCNHEDPETSAWNELVVAGKIIDNVSLKLEPHSIYQSTWNLEIDPVKSPGRLPWQNSTLQKFLDEMIEGGYLKAKEISKAAPLRTLFVDGAYWASLLALQSSKSLHRSGIHVEGARHSDRIAEVISELLKDDCNYDDLPHEATLHTLHELSKIQYRRRIACCESGRLALAPDRVRSGDKVVLLHGSRFPVILRPRPGTDGHFLVVGACYYDGAMYGELADPVDENACLFTLV